ncbi:MAG: site-specific integrase [Methylophilus sp.]|nr:site-specific integrase [Methylophilus sp.]
MSTIKRKIGQNKPQDSLEELLSILPELPGVVRYYDDFDNQLRSIKNFKEVKVLDLYIRGRKSNLYMNNYDKGMEEIAKHLFLYLISQGLSVSTAYNRLISLYQVRRETLVTILDTNPSDFMKLWITLFSEYSLPYLLTIKSLLFFLANGNYSVWTSEYNSFISKLSLPFQDKFASIKKGDVFLNSQEEAKIVEYLDNISLHLADDFKVIRNAGLVLCAYQFGMRPVQIALLTMRDIRIWDNVSDVINTVHLTFKTVKQRSKSSSHILLRKVKAEWSPIFIALNKFNLIDELSGDDRIFRLNSANEVSNVIRDEVSLIIGRKSSATDLRHTAAQRMVDGGASQEELAEFMGHTDITTGLVYFQTSANQAERVNQALGISPIYQQVVKIAHDKFISKEELSDLKGAYQIAGVPHGIPIAGIGGCSSGQPACPYNPVTSCYGCRKFMPLHDINVHEQVLDDMRSIVGFFNTESKGDQSSPTYLQLQNTINGVQQIIAEIRGSNHASAF